MKKVALVTGTSTGVGLSSSILLARSGFKVFATMRDPKKAGALKERAEKEGVDLNVLQLDVCDSESVNTCVDTILKGEGRIDLLLNNAGMGFLGGIEHTSFKDLETVFNVNFFGVWRVTQAVLPSMRLAKSGHIISVSSVGGLIGQPFNDAYCAAKFAVEGMMESLAPVMKRFSVNVSLVEPGPINTEFVSNIPESGVKSPEDETYRLLIDSYVAGSREVFKHLGQTGDEVAAVIVEAATSPTPHLRYQTTPGMTSLVSSKYVDPTGDSVLVLNGSRLPQPEELNTR